MAQGRLPSPSINNATITGGVVTSDTSGSNVTATAGSTNTLANWLQGAPTAWGTAAGANTGTSGATVPLLNGTNTWSGPQTVTGTLTAAGGSFATANNHINLGLTTSAVTPFVDFFSSGTGTAGFRVISTANNNLTFLAGTATNVGSFSATGFGSPLSVTNGGVSNVLSGSSSKQWLSFNSNVSGTFTGSTAYNFLGTNSDIVDASGASQSRAPAILSLNSQFGGVGTKGSRLTLTTNITQTAATSDVPGTGTTYIPLKAFTDMTANVGGTSLAGGFTNGSAYAFYPQVWLHPGATNYTIAAGAEWDMVVEGTKQILTVGAGNTTGDVITVTMTGASIVGSPVAVTYTVGAGNTQTNIANGISAAVFNNAALNVAGVSAQINIAAPTTLVITWPTQNTVSATVGTSGAGTVSLGSVVTGASTLFRKGMSISRLSPDSVQGSVQDVAFAISDGTNAFRSGQWRAGITFGDLGQGAGMWPIAATGTMIGAGQQNIFTAGGIGGAFAPAVAKYGIDFHVVNFASSSIWVPGVKVSGTGVLSVQNATLTTDTSGLTLAVTGVVGSGNPAIVSGGGGGSGSANDNYFVGDIITDANGGQYLVSAVNNSTGAATSLTTLVQPSHASSLGTAIATTGGSGAGLTITPTAAANTTINLANITKMASFTVATLPAAAAGNAGAIAYVTDATAPTYRGALTGGGAVKTLVFSDGTAWTSH